MATELEGASGAWNEYLDAPQQRLERHRERFAAHAGTGDDAPLVLRSLPVPGIWGDIDEIMVGAGGVTVVLTEECTGKVRVRRGRLLVDDQNRTMLVARAVRQLELVCLGLVDAGLGAVDVKGAICFTAAQGRALANQPAIDGVRICGPSGLAALARRPGRRGVVDAKVVASALRGQLEETSAAA